jgi:hypothetical protein
MHSGVASRILEKVYMTFNTAKEFDIALQCREKVMLRGSISGERVMGDTYDAVW